MRKIDRRRAFLEAGALSAAALCFAPRAKSAPAWEGFDELYLKPPWFPDGRRFLEEAPPEIATGGRLRLGVFREPCRNMNLDQARVFAGGELRWWGAPKLQEWVGYGLAHQHRYFGMIIMDLKLRNFASVYALDRRSGKTFFHDAIGSGKNSGVAKTSWSGRTYMDKKGFKMEFIHDLDHGRHRIKIDIAGKKDKPGVQMDLLLHQDRQSFQPLVVSMPIEPRHYMYTHKAMMNVEGSAEIGDERIQYDPRIHLAAMDEFKSFWPVPKRWTWGTAEGKDQSGRPIALNLVDYYTRDQEWWNENCCWSDGKMSLLGPVQWELDLKDPIKPWRVRERSGRAEATFFPEGGKIMDLSPIPFKYYQKCGRYEGFVIDDQGQKHEFHNLYGPAENGRIG